MEICAVIKRHHKNSVDILVKNGEVVVCAPYGLDEESIVKIVKGNADYCRKKIDIQQNSSNNCKSTCVFGNVSLAAEMFSCKKVLLAGVVFEVVPGDVAKTALSASKLIVNEKCFDDTIRRKKAVVSFLKEIANQCLRKEISQFGTNIALCPAAINLTKLKSAGWIRCKDMANRVVTMDYRVIQLPFELRNYLIAHVFSHFFQPGHDVEFFRVLSNYLPNFDALQTRLDAYSFLKEIE
ncbi:MAG: DUF45 domain-containing protein [Clostridia bacterium]|nr:DUF45 domain-containing protein [Clostridia bacterium]